MKKRQLKPRGQAVAFIIDKLCGELSSLCEDLLWGCR